MYTSNMTLNPISNHPSTLSSSGSSSSSSSSTVRLSSDQPQHQSQQPQTLSKPPNNIYHHAFGSHRSNDKSVNHQPLQPSNSSSPTNPRPKPITNNTDLPNETYHDYPDQSATQNSLRPYPFSHSNSSSFKPIQSIQSLLSKQFKTTPSIQIAIIVLIFLATLTIFIDYWTHAHIYILRYPWTVSSSSASNSHSTSWKAIARSYLGLPACDPFSEPGSVIFNETYYDDANWVPYGSSCPPSPDYLSGLRALRNVPISLPLDQRNGFIRHPIQSSRTKDPALESDHQGGFSRHSFDVWGRPYPDLNFLRGKTILVLGDSVDRNSLEHLYQLVGARVRSFFYNDIDHPPPPDWDRRSTPWEVNLGLLHPRNLNQTQADHQGEFAGLNCRVINGFFYGLDDIDEFSVQGDWHAPGLAESRVKELYEPMTKAFALEDGEEPAFISLQSGLWDLAFFGRRNRESNETTNEPLTAEQIDWWQGRFRSLIKTIKITWPNTPIWIRSTHRVGDQFWAAHDWQAGLKHGLGKGFVNFFPDHRIHQIRQMQLFIAREEGLPIFDFYNLWEGYQKFQDKVHPLKVPGGVLMNQALLHHVWMESIGRDNWDSSFLTRNRIGKLPHNLNQFY